MTSLSLSDDRYEPPRPSRGLVGLVVLLLAVVAISIVGYVVAARRAAQTAAERDRAVTEERLAREAEARATTERDRVKAAAEVNRRAWANSRILLAEAAWHHPDLTVTWGKVWVKLKTHSAGGITDKDFALARKIEELALWRPPAGSPLTGPKAKFVHTKD